MALGLTDKKPPEQRQGRRTNHQGVGRSEALQAGGDWGYRPRQLFVPVPAPHLPHHHESGMHPQAHGELHAALLGEAAIQLCHGLNHPQASRHGPLGVIFMGAGVAQIDQQAIPQILRDMALEAGNHPGAGVLIGPHHPTQVFRIELRRSPVESTRSQNRTVS